MDDRQRRRTLLPCVLLGVGLGGLLDGIVLHALLQWHHYVSHVRPPVTLEALRENVTVDGAFLLGAWTVTVVAVAALWRAGRRGALPNGIAFVGAALLGWGAFNIVDGVVNHWILGLHHVRESDTSLDVPFLLASVALVVLGVALVRRGVRAEGDGTSGASPTSRPGG
jgi:uncharacterized membrane protein